MRIPKALTLVVIVMFHSFALASSGGEHGEAHGIPWALIGQQVFNLLIVIGGLSFLLRKKVTQHFAERKVQYSQLIQKAEEAKVAAEKSKREITERLQQLESTADSSLQNAKSEAEELKRKIVEEAKTLSQRLEDDAKRTAEYEIQRAKIQLRKDLLEQSLIVARENLEKQVGTAEQNRLNSEFVQKVQVVQ
ncbi:MAG: ATP synthase F0 subunit B [Bdellovibrionales bacterium]|nr:ATP synthase F0 subunit B [Bdellovibrionales bacterium]